MRVLGKIFKLLVLFIVVMVAFIFYTTNISASCDYIFFTEKRLSIRLEQAIETKNISLLRYIMGQGRVCKKEKIYNQAVEQIKIIEKQGGK